MVREIAAAGKIVERATIAGGKNSVRASWFVHRTEMSANRKFEANRKGAAMWIRVTVGLVILIIVLMVVGGALGAFVRSLAASPEDHAISSQQLMARAIRDVINEGDGWVLPECKKFELHLTTGYYLTVSETDYGSNGEIILEAIEDAEGGPKRVRAAEIKGSETVNQICCHNKFDNEGLCNTHCGDKDEYGNPKSMLIGKNAEHHKDVCVCIFENSVYIYSPMWLSDYTIGTDSCADVGAW